MQLANGNLVLVKTGKGQDEVTGRKHALSLRQRQALIIIDGVKTLDGLRKLVSHADFYNDLQFLLDAGLIAPKEGAFSAALQTDPAGQPVPVAAVAGAAVQAPARPIAAESVSASASASAAPQSHGGKLGAADLKQIKNYMISKVKIYLGLLGDGLVQHIEQANDSAELAPVIGQWHLALRESKRGRLDADVCFKELMTALRGMELETQAA